MKIFFSKLLDKTNFILYNKGKKGVEPNSFIQEIQKIVDYIGDERTGNDNIKTFQRGTKFPGDNTSKTTTNNLKVILNGITIIDKNF